MNFPCSQLFCKIRNKFHFTFSIETLELFFKEIFTDLTKRSSSTTLDKQIFIDYLNIPILISDKIYNLINSSQDQQLKETDFIYSLSKLYLGEIEMLLQILTSLLDLTNDSCIHKSDIYLLLSLLDYKHNKDTREIVDHFFKEARALRKEEFIERSTESNVDVFALFMVYLLSKAPFTEEQVNYFFKEQMTLGRCFNTNGNGSIIGGGTFKASPSAKLIDFVNQRFDLYLGNEDFADDEYSELAELSAFEKNISCVLSNIEIELINPKKRKNSLNDSLLNTHFALASLTTSNSNISNSNKESTIIQHKPLFDVVKPLPAHKDSLQTEAMGFCPGTAIPYHFQSQASISIKPLALPVIKSTSSLLSIDNGNSIQMLYQDMNNTIKQCRLVLISNCLYIETEIDQSSKSSNSLLARSNSFTNDSLYSFKYSYLISLATAFTENIPRSTLPGFDSFLFYGFKVISSLNNIKKEIKFYSKDKAQLDSFMLKVNKEEPNSSSCLSNFDITKQIGNGQYSRVYLAKDLKSNKMIALKELLKDNINSAQSIQLTWEKDILTLLSYALHPNVIRSYYHFMTQKSLFFVFEYMPNGTLGDYLSKTKGHFDIQIKYDIINQLCSGLAFLHSLNIVHCDLKPDNILLSLDNENKNISVKIGDFGFARILTKNQTFTESFGTLAYIAPEILQRFPYSFKVDIWSLGVIIFQLLFGEIPFGEGVNDLKVMKNMIVKGHFSFPQKDKSSVQVDKVYYDIISNCLNVDSSKRPKCQEIIALIKVNSEVHTKKDSANCKNTLNEDEHDDNIENLNTKH